MVVRVVHYIGRHGSKRVAKVGLVGAVPPLMLKTETNPEGTPIGVFDDIRKGTASNRSQFFKELTILFYGFNRPAGDDAIAVLAEEQHLRVPRIAGPAATHGEKRIGCPFPPGEGQ